MIYLDTSVALAAIFAESRQPPAAFWKQDLCSSRLLEYEIMTRLNARGLNRDDARDIFDQTELIDLTPTVLARALQPFPQPVRTLDGLHLATMDFLRAHGQTLQLASYDQRLMSAATALGFALAAV